MHHGRKSGPRRQLLSNVHGLRDRSLILNKTATQTPRANPILFAQANRSKKAMLKKLRKRGGIQQKTAARGENMPLRDNLFIKKLMEREVAVEGPLVVMTAVPLVDVVEAGGRVLSAARYPTAV